MDSLQRLRMPALFQEGHRTSPGGQGRARLWSPWFLTLMVSTLALIPSATPRAQIERSESAGTLLEPSPDRVVAAGPGLGAERLTAPGTDSNSSPGAVPGADLSKDRNLEGLLESLRDRLLRSGDGATAVAGHTLRPGDARGANVVDPVARVSSRRPPHGWAPFRGEFGTEEAAHLLRRTEIGPRFVEIVEAADAGLGPTLDRLLQRHDVALPGDWVDEPVPDWWQLTPSQRDSVLSVYLARQTDLRLWWTARLVDSPPDLTETMTLFWHDHFATAMQDVTIPQAMYIQQELFRKHATGSFRALLTGIARDPAMLIWLDGRMNIASDPNENFARELFELFTLGEGAGYSQTDIEEAARALTGWTTDGVSSWFEAWRFDDGEKTILGQTGEFGTGEVLNLLLDRPETARHLCDKLYRRFLADDPAPEDIEALALILRESNYEVAPVLRTIFSSEAFFDREYRGALVKDGVDIYCGALRTFEVSSYDPYRYSVQARFVLLQMEEYGQVLFDPPNVAGWPGHLNWINTQTLPKRKSYLDALVSRRFGRLDLSMGIDVLGFTRGLSAPNDPHAIVDDLATLWFGQAPTELVRETMLATLLQGAEPYDWSIDLPDARQRLMDLYRFVFRLPEGQLK